MIHTPNYYKATNEAYNLLLKQDILEIPINLSSLLHLRHQNTRLATYAQMASRFSMTTSDYKNMAPSEFGFTMKEGEKNYILYNEEKGYHTNRFTIAHELGHIMLNHKAEDAVEEREANCFARNLLCPIPVVDSLNITNVDAYMGWFHVSDLMAENCINIAKSDRYYIEEHLYRDIDDLLYTYMTGQSLVEAYGYSY